MVLRSKNVVLYVLNNRTSPKWFYNYDSSITRAQREMTHHLVAYVFQALSGIPSQTQQESQLHQDQSQGVVVARHASPGFFLVSYRRSGAANNPGCSLPALPVDGSSDNVEVSASEIRSASRIVQQQAQQQHRLQLQLRQHHHHQQQRLPGQQQQQLYINSAQEQPQHFAPFPDTHSVDCQKPTRTENAVTTHSNEYADVSTENWRPIDLETLTPGFCEKAQHLLILWRVIERISLRDLEHSTSPAHVHVRSHWLRAAAALRAPPIRFDAQLEAIIASFLSSVFESVPAWDNQRYPSSSSGSNPFTMREQCTIRASAHLFLRALSSRTVMHLLHSACRMGNHDGARRELLDKFVSLILNLYEVLEDVLSDVAANGDAAFKGSLPAMVDDVLSLVYGRTHFGALRAEVSCLLLDQQTPNSVANALNNIFRVFTCQTQEFVAQSESRIPQPPRQQNYRENIGGSQDPWNRRWLLEPGSVHTVNTGQGGVHPDVSLTGAAQLIRELGCIDIETTGGGTCMSVRSVVSFAGGTPTCPMELMLDGQLREFKVLPSGLSSKIETAGGWYIGDYVAVLSDDRQAMDFRFFAFAEDTSAASTNDGMGGVTVTRQVSMSLILEQVRHYDETVDRAHARDVFVVVHGTVFSSTYSCVMQLSRMSLRDRGTIWNELSWTPMIEVNAGYVAI
ncbi:hypothetical protein ON010_g4561 [Phytophthora cinnamomi]|nr:hypothetical protein ON010_g4561 [Phytophthora cinnamomi]